MTGVPGVSPPELDLDPFSEEFLAAPGAYHQLLRDAGPVVWLSRYRIWAMARTSALRAPWASPMSRSTSARWTARATWAR